MPKPRKKSGKKKTKKKGQTKTYRKKVSIYDAKTVIKKKGETKRLPVEKKPAELLEAGPKDFTGLRLRDIKELCRQAGNKSKASQAILHDEFEVLRQGVKLLQENRELVKKVDLRWMSVNRVFTQWEHAERAEFESDRERHNGAAQHFINVFAESLKVGRKPLGKVLSAEFELRKTKRFLFQKLSEILGPEFTEKFKLGQFASKLTGALPELQPETRRRPRKE